MDTTPGYTFDEFELDVPGRELRRSGEPVPLGGRAFEVLLSLVKRAGALVEKDELIAQAWPDTHASDDNLKQAVSVLRRALGEDPEQPRFVLTVPRRGYKFIAPVTEHRSDDAAPPIAEVSAPFTAPGRPRLALAMPLAALVLVVLGTIALVPAQRADDARLPGLTPVRFEHTAPAGTTLASGGELAPDGSHLAFVARDAATGRTRLWVRSLLTSRSRQLPGTDGAFRPFWSPDSRDVAFFADGRLKKIALTGSAPQELARVGYRPAGGTWSSQGIVLYADRSSRIYGVSENGDGQVFAVTTLDGSRQEIAHRAPQFLPDGRTFLFSIASANPDHEGTYIASLDDPSARHRLIDGAATHVTFAPPSHVIYLRQNALVAHAFDMSGRRLVGAGVPIGGLTTRSRTFSVGGGGLLAFGGETTAQHLTWFGRDGRSLGPLAPGMSLHNPALTPDGRQLVANADGIWVVDVDRGAPTRIGDGNLPTWGPDGAVVFTRRGARTADLVIQAIDEGNEERLLVRSKEMKLSGHWSPDGHRFAYVASNPDSRLDIWLLDVNANGSARPFLQAAANEMQPRISPDGRWIAYASDETGAWEVYVRSFPSGGGKRAVSLGGGVEPQWARDGDELLYLRPDGTMMTVPMEAAEGVMQPGMPEALFRVALSGDITTYRNHYAVTSDGSRFIVDTTDESTREPVSVVVHWQQLLPR